MSVIKITNSVYAELVYHSGRAFARGILVGLSRIASEYLGADKIEIQELSASVGQELSTSVKAYDVAFLDHRQTAPYAKIRPDIIHFMSIGVITLGDVISSMTQDFVVLAPSQLLPPRVTWTLFWQRTLLFGMIFGTTLVFLAIRLFSSQMEPAGRLDRGLFLFDTFARTLGASAGAWQGRSTSERQLLVVLATFAILMGGIFSGVLYERSFPAEGTERFKTMQDICESGLDVTVDWLFRAFFAVFYKIPELGDIRYISNTTI